MEFRFAFTFLLLVLFWVSPNEGSSQHPERFRKEIDSIVVSNRPGNPKNVIVFTGSSSIRLWKNLKADFPHHNVVNMGFGGSEMKDLLHYTNDVILNFKPTQVFIYEGDNDIGNGKTPEQILASADSIVTVIRKTLPLTQVIFISPKPSIRRWHLKEKYEVFNDALKQWTTHKTNIHFADVWTPMLDRGGKVRQDIFLADDLHLNEKGYAIWKTVLEKFLP